MRRNSFLQRSALLQDRDQSDKRGAGVAIGSSLRICWAHSRDPVCHPRVARPPPSPWIVTMFRRCSFKVFRFTPLMLAIAVSALTPDMHMQRVRQPRTRVQITKQMRRDESAIIGGIAA